MGNSAPLVVEAVSEQVANLTHTCFMVAGYEPYVDVCEALNELTPGDHEKRSALFNSGAEAVENAVKIARHYTGRDAIVALEHGYHGRTNLTMGLTAKSMPFKHRFGPFTPEIYRMPTSYPLRDGRDGPAAAAEAIRRMSLEIGADGHRRDHRRADPGRGWLHRARARLPTRRWPTTRPSNGIVFIADEIQTGFARTGDWFASEHEGVVPDLDHHRQGHRRRPAAGRRHRPRGHHGQHPRRRPRRHLRRQPGGLRRGAGLHPDHEGAATWPPARGRSARP